MKSPADVLDLCGVLALYNFVERNGTVADLRLHTMQGRLKSSDGESICTVSQRVAGAGEATYYNHADIVDSSVYPRLQDGDYEFYYASEPDEVAVVTRKDGSWLKVPPSTKKPRN